MQSDIDEWIDEVAHQQNKQTLLKLIERQRVPFSTLHAIYQTTQELQEKQDIRLLSGFNPLLFETINGMPTPFIYERLGVKYTNFYVDEFQDTSVLQWKNLIPLLENATATTDSTDTFGWGCQTIDISLARRLPRAVYATYQRRNAFFHFSRSH